LLAAAATPAGFASDRAGGGFHGAGFGGFRSSAPALRSNGMRFAFSTRPSFGRPAYVRPRSRATTEPFGRTSATRARSTARPGQPKIAAAGTHIYATYSGNWHQDWDHRGAHFWQGHWWAWDGACWVGLDAGFYPWDFYPYYAYDYYPYDYYPGYYTDVEPYYDSEGVYDTVPASDPNVATVQQNLMKLGYYNGSIDGLYGRMTRDAVARYQSARHFVVTGTLTRQTLQSLGVTVAT
jgi:hypothetical protein